MVHNCQCVFRTFWSSSSASIYIFAFLLSLISFILILFIFFSWLIVGVMSKLCIYFLSTKNCLRRFCNAIIIITTKMIEFHLLKWNITSTNSINYSKSDFKVIMQSMQHRLVYHKQQKKCEMAGWNLSNIVLNLCWKMCSNLVFSIQPKTFSMMFLFVCLFDCFFRVWMWARVWKRRKVPARNSFSFVWFRFAYQLRWFWLVCISFLLLFSFCISTVIEIMFQLK